MAITVMDGNEKAFMESMGHQYEKGFTPAYDHDRKLKGVLNEEGKFFVTLPLNGWRARSLAETVFGERDASLWTLGKTVVVPTKRLRDLPGFDGRYCDLLESIEETHRAKMGVLRVVDIDPGYGVHVTFHTGVSNTVFE